MPWHTDACYRLSVIVRGQQLTIEFRDTGEQMGVVVHPGMVGWPRNNIAVIERQMHALYRHVGVSHRRTLYNMYILRRVGGVETQSYSSYRGSHHRAQAVKCKKCHLDTRIGPLISTGPRQSGTW
jgi:hypothetical protein